jgi:hypothetical protein
MMDARCGVALGAVERIKARGEREPEAHVAVDVR